MASNRTEAFKLYQTVIEDTISNVREAFLDEGIDEQILIELKQIWEQRLEQSRAVDTGEPPQTHHVQSYHDIQAAQAAQRQQAKEERAAAARSTSSNAKSQKKQAAQQQQQQATSYIDSSSTQLDSHSTLTPQAAAATLALPQGVLQLQPHQLAQLQGVTTLPAGVTVSGQQFPAYQVQGGSGFQIVQQPVSVPEGQLQPGQVIQFTTQAGSTATVQGNALQVDGGNDTSDEEDEYDDDDNDDNDDDDADDKDDGPNDVEEEPLNSDDDVSDEDAAELFETDNVVVCQYDRINRNRNKWKFTLKSGIMNLKGKDHVFFKATGDAEW